MKGKYKLNLIKIFKRSKIEELKNEVVKDSSKLIKMAEEILLGRKTTASNGGGGFETVTLMECTGIVINKYRDNQKEVRFKVDDSWIKGVYYPEEHIIKMYDKYLRTGKKPKIHSYYDENDNFVL